jgi:transposase
MKITTVGIDLAKNVFQIHAANAQGKALINKQLPRSKMAEFFISLPPCLVAMEACSSAHFWARKFAQMGHTVRLIAPQFVKPYVKSNKTMRPTPRQFARLLRARRCVLFRSRMLSNNAY